MPCPWRVLLLAGGSVRYGNRKTSKDTAKLTTKALLSPGNAFRGWSSLPGTLSMKTVSRLGLSASKAFLSEIIRNSSFSTGRVLNSSPTLPTRPVRSVSSQSCASHNLSMVQRTWYCLPNIRLPFLLEILFPSFSFHRFVQSRPRLSKRG